MDLRCSKTPEETDTGKKPSEADKNLEKNLEKIEIKIYRI